MARHVTRRIWHGIRDDAMPEEERTIQQVRQAPAVRMREDDPRCRVGEFRLCVNCPGSDGYYSLNRTIRHIGVGALFEELPPKSERRLSETDEPSAMADFIQTVPAEGSYCDDMSSKEKMPLPTGGTWVTTKSDHAPPISTTNARHTACVPGWNIGDGRSFSGSGDYLDHDWECEFTLQSGASTETYRRYAFARESWSVRDATWIDRASKPSSCQASSNRDARQQTFISENSGCGSEGWTHTPDDFDCSQVYTGSFEACFRRSKFRQGDNGGCGPKNWLHDFETWQCNNCQGQNDHITLNWDAPIPKVNAFKWAQLCETVDAASACVDRVQVTIVHSGGSTTETVEGLQCLGQQDIPEGFTDDCLGPFRTRFEERDWKQFNFLSQTFTQVTSIKFALANRDPTSANDGHAGVQEIEVGYASRPRSAENNFGAVFWIPEDQAQHYCNAEGNLAQGRGVRELGRNPAQCTVTQRAKLFHTGVTVAFEDQERAARLPVSRGKEQREGSETRTWFESGAACLTVMATMESRSTRRHFKSVWNAGKASALPLAFMTSSSSNKETAQYTTCQCTCPGQPAPITGLHQ